MDIGSAINDNELKITQSISLPLYQAKGWMKFIGVLNIIAGIPSLIVLIGAVYIWMGYLLVKAADNVEIAQMRGSANSLAKSMDNLRLYFVINGILSILGVLFSILMVLIWAAGLSSLIFR